jgi:hypothetical protein
LVQVQEVGSGGLGGVASVQVPQLEELEATRVPVTLLYVPVMPLMDTSEPVTARLAFTWASQLLAAREPIASHEPGVPEAVLLYGSEELGFPVPVKPELEQNRQPDWQMVQLVGQSAGLAYTQTLVGVALMATGPPVTCVKLVHCEPTTGGLAGVRVVVTQLL